MALSDFAKTYRRKALGERTSSPEITDPEFIDLFDNFAFDEVVQSDDLDDVTRFMIILAYLLGCQGLDAFEQMAQAALNFGMRPAQLREVVYQATAYLGMGRVLPFIKAMDEILAQRGIELPLAPETTTDASNRRKKGTQKQVEIFGDKMADFYKSGPQETRHINYWLAANCFGDYYTRGVLSNKEREMITFCFIAGQGGCENQLVAHARGNINVGNDRAFLIKVVSQGVPYIGYPRTLNALAALNKACEE